MQRLFSLVLIAAMLFPLAGCDEDAVITNAYKIIRTAGTVYDAGMRASADAYASGKLSPEQRKQLDIEYARQMSPWFDLKIILRTFTAFIQKENV